LRDSCVQSSSGFWPWDMEHSMIIHTTYMHC